MLSNISHDLSCVRRHSDAGFETSYNLLLRVRNAELFDLSELVNTEDTPDISPVLLEVSSCPRPRDKQFTYSAGLLAEASRVTRIPDFTLAMAMS
jgi:hypothetical protein